MKQPLDARIWRAPLLRRIFPQPVAALITSAAWIAILSGATYMQAMTGGSKTAFNWRDLPSLPQSIAGQCVGTIGDLLVAAGGSSWTKPPWDGGVKHWSNNVYALAPGAKEWHLIGHLPNPVGYGSAVQDGKKMLCIGGQDAERTYRTALQLGMEDGKLSIEHLPDLPRPVTNASAGISGGKVYVFGGQQTLNPKDISHEIYSLDLAGRSPSREWRESPPPWKHARILPVVAGCGNDLYVLSGADLVLDEKGNSHRSYLSDAWRLKDGQEWERLPDLPVPVAGAPSICSASGTPIILGGDDGRLAEEIFTLKDRHPGFSLKMLLFNAHTLRWSFASGQLPLSLATSGAVAWNGLYVIAGGENKPGHRSNRVIGSSIPPSLQHEDD